MKTEKNFKNEKKKKFIFYKVNKLKTKIHVEKLNKSRAEIQYKITKKLNKNWENFQRKNKTEETQ